MHKLVALTALAFAVSAIGAAAPAGAATVADCEAQINQLAGQTEGATFTGKNAAKELSGLLGKLTNANTKLSEGKNEDAILKLQDFQAQVRVLGQTGKLAPGDAERLDAGAESAIACVNTIGT